MNTRDLRYSFCAWLVIIILTIGASIGHTQCIIDEINGETIQIQDFRTIGLKLIVRDAVHADLSDPDQGICGVRISFSHTQVSDVRMELIAPDGSKVTLIGPATLDGTIRSLPFPINHDILFVPSTEPTAPDPFASDRWTNNLPTWSTISNYTGIYYPNFGDLDIDFASGPIDGIWELRVSDDFLNDEGIINSFELIFCDSASVNCIQCEADAGFYGEEEVFGCVGVDLDDDLWQVESNSDPSEYSLFYLLDSAGITRRIDDSFSFENLPSGDYRISAVSVINADFNALVAEVDQGISLDSLDNLSNGKYCFSPSATPLNISIGAPDTMQIVVPYCLESPTIYQGISITNPDTIVTIRSEDCEEFLVVSFDNTTIQANIVEDTLAVGCRDRFTTIDASRSDTGVSGIVNWSWNGVPQLTTGLMIEGDLGTYILEIEEDGCFSRDTVEIISEFATTEYDFTVDGFITCNQPQASIEIEQKNVISSSIWSGPGIVSEYMNVEQIIVEQGGTYTINFTDTAGCIGLAESFEVLSNTALPQFSIVSDSIQCDHSIANIVILSQDSAISANWQLGDEILLDSPVFGANRSETLFIEVFAENGCTVDTSLFVKADTNTVIIISRSDALTCIVNELLLDGNVSGSGINYEWFDASGMISTNSSITVSSPDDYTLIASKINGCSDTAVFSVRIDTIQPAFSIVYDSIITCLVDSAILNVNLGPDISIEWNNPDFPNANNPRQVVFDGGIYDATISSVNNGCTALIDAEVTTDVQDPFFVPEVLDIDCDNPIGSFSVSSLEDVVVSLEINNEPPIIATEFQSTDRADIVYTVTGQNGCAVSDMVVIEKNDFPPEILAIDTLELNCNITEVTIAPQLEPDIIDFFIILPNGDTTRVNSLQTRDPGSYSVNAIGETGCQFSVEVTVLEDMTAPSAALGIVDEVFCDQTELQIDFDDFFPDSDISRDWQVLGDAAVFEFGNTSVLSGNGTFILQLNNTKNGCASMDTFELAFIDSPFGPYRFSAFDESCAGDGDGMINGFDLPGGEGQVAIQINDQPFEDFDLSTLASGTYNFTAMDELGCRVDTTVVIAAGNFIGFELGADILLFPNEQLILDPVINMDGPLSLLQWTFDDQVLDVDQSSLNIDPQNGGLLSLVVIDDSGCSHSDSVLVTVALESNDLFYIPNAFHPSSTLGNNLVIASFSDRIASINSFNIYDRWGELVYQLNNFLPGVNLALWDGRINSTLASSGVYVYYLEMTLSNGQVERSVGDITLLR